MSEKRIEPGSHPRLTTRPSTAPRRVVESAVAVLIPASPASGMPRKILRGVQQAFRRQGVSVRLAYYDTSSTVRHPTSWSMTEQEALRKVRADTTISGMVLWLAAGDDSTPLIEELLGGGITAVFIDRLPTSPLAARCDFVGVDDRAGAREAVSHLIHLGHRRVAHATYYGTGTLESRTSTVASRLAGYRDALREAGIPSAEEMVAEEDEIAQRIAAGGPEAPTAVFAVNDALARHQIALIREADLRVPEDVSVVGFDDLGQYQDARLALTTVHIPFDRIGDRAAEALLHRWSHPVSDADPARHMLEDTKLIVRATTAAPHPAAEEITETG